MLSKRGKCELLAAARALSGKRIDAVYSSDLGRAWQSALILAKECGWPAPVADARLREQHFGIYQGRQVTAMLQDLRRDGGSWAAWNPRGGERADQVHTRVRAFVADAIAAHSGETLLLVTHSILIRALLHGITPESGSMPKPALPRGIVAVVEVDGANRSRLAPFNSLPEAPVPGCRQKEAVDP